MDRKVAWVLVAVLLAGLVAIFYPRRVADPPMAPLELPEQTSTAADRSPPFGPPPEAAPEFVAEEPPEPLPALDESDAEARAALADAAGSGLVARHLAPNAVVRKLVATVDNLDGGTIWMRTRVVPRSEGLFLVDGNEEELFLAASNAGRYTAFVQLVDAIDMTRLAAAYQRHYPLLQQAYEELGYRKLEIGPSLTDPSFFSTVTPGQFPTCCLPPVSPLKSVVFPLFGFPTTAIV